MNLGGETIMINLNHPRIYKPNASDRVVWNPICSSIWDSFWQGQRVLTGTGLTQQRLPSVRSPSPISGSSPVAAATHGGATYFLGPGQGISSLSHAFSSPVGRNESRTARSQFPAGTVPFGSRFLPDQLREELRRRHSLIHAQVHYQT